MKDLKIFMSILIILVIGALYKVSEGAKIDESVVWIDAEMWWTPIRRIRKNELFLCLDDSYKTKLKVLLESGEIAWIQSHNLVLIA